LEQRTFIQSLNDAVEGFIYVIRSEKNMRIHFFLGFLVLLGAIFLGVSKIEWIILCLSVCFVWISEMVNTAIEETMDHIQETFHPAVRIIKDVSAGAVLISVANSLVVGILIFSNYWHWPLEKLAWRLRYTDWHITFISLLVVIFLVIFAKVVFHRGTPLKGGIVSGHAAVVFSLWTAVIFTGAGLFAVFAALLLALLVIQGRLRAKVHTVWETLAGAVLGILVTALFFQLLR
jgi:diacylglycerol kinase (ATP)